jgi:hypothetical protein
LTFVDTNILIDIITADAEWAAWSWDRLDEALLAGPLLINDIVYAELASRYRDISELDAFIDGIPFRLEPVPRAALFLAGHIYARYRRSGGTRTGILPDFFIGAHAAVTGETLLTRDVGRYRTYFPTVKIVAPGIN